MSSPCTRLVRCRVRDLASCFYACRLPLEEEHDSICSKRPQTSNGKTISGCKIRCGTHKAKKMSKKDGEEYLAENLSPEISKGGRVGADGSGSEPRFAEEDYIVFCFREDGEIDMINEVNTKSSSEAYHDEVDEHAAIISAATILRPIANRKKDDVSECPPDDEINSIEQPNNASKMDSFESCDSNLSDTSTSSFAFPELGLDWIGSPVHMPKSEKPEARSLRLHCCSF